MSTQAEEIVNNYIIRDEEPLAPSFDKAYAVASSLAKKIHNVTYTDSMSKTDALLRNYYLSTASKKLYTSFMSIDLRNFTMLSHERSTDEISRLITSFSYSISNLVSACGGHVLKYVGDAVLSFFPTREPSSSVKRALIASASISRFMNNAFLPEFKRLSLRTNYGIGVDFGESAIVKVGSASSKLHYDLIGKPINVSVKLQSMALNGQILITERASTFYRGEGTFSPFSSYEKHPSGISGALLKAKNLIFRKERPDNILSFSPPSYTKE
ncbi:MAG: adenylate/guanylate cyclase domain-containing protein [Methanobacteriota archaeon]|nr:MAG: adenylate/guanylate cyclase domain-containing protein [Euryarchaeota archaeon]